MKTIELFAGAGGLAIGIARAGFLPVLIVERDRWCCNTLRENRAFAVGEVRDWPIPTEDDIRNVDFHPYEGHIDLVAGGPPCQPFSAGGRHHG